MAEPSNIRVNPFTGTGGATNYVELTEKHIIPAVSPYVIRLNEVPEKQDPSNMKMVYVNESTGAATSTTLTEVAATPGQGEFRPDYSTNAMEDKTWNTGLIEFSASDAGKIVQVTYTGTGMLAGVTSNHWPSWYTDRGDGSDGDFVPTGNTTISGVKNYKSVFIKSGLTITVDKYVLIKCQGAFVNKGTITANGKGYTSSTPGFTNNGGAGGNGYISGGGDNGAAGGLGGCCFNQYLTAAITKDLLEYMKVVGIGTGGGKGGGASGNSGGSGGTGGGAIVVICGSFSNNSISVNGVRGGDGTSGGSSMTKWYTGGGGGGAGGTIVVVANTIIKSGTLSAAGGSGGTSGGSNATSGSSGGTGFVYTKTMGA